MTPIVVDPTAPDADIEAARLRAVERYRIVDTPTEPVFERIASLTARATHAPIAIVSIVDRDGIWFTAMHGLSDIGNRIDRDDGLCGLAVATGAPLVVEDAQADNRTVHRRFVRERSIRFYACVPIITFDGHAIGAVAVMDTRPRTASDEQIAILDDLAAIVMEQLELRLSTLDALHLEERLRTTAEQARDTARGQRDTARVDRTEARRDRDAARVDRDDAIRDRDIAEHERDVIEQYATTLQRTLLPPSLPAVPGLSLAALYHPASTRQVGGDFYDVFGLGGDRWAFFVGDVQGHGVDAAVATSLIRYTLRSTALHYADPTRVLTELNTVMLRENQPRRFCTVLFGTLRPAPDGDGFVATVATGGHPPALLLDAVHNEASPIRSADGMLVGAWPDATFQACSTHLRRGQTLLLYTDGLTEARRGVNPFDEDRLADFAMRHASGGARGLVDELAAFIPKLEPEDDVALLAFSAD